MPFDSNGTYTRLRGSSTWVGDAAAGTKILSGLHDDNDNDMASALSDCLNRTGRGTPLVNMNWGGFKITNLGSPAVGSNDAANARYVETIPGWATAKYISGADLNGRLNFTAASGTNGITWTYASMALVARKAKANETSDRLAVSNTHVPATASNAGDVFVIDDIGHINGNGQVTNNLSWDGANWRTISPGYGSLLDFTGGDFRLLSNDVATITNPYVSSVQRQYFSAANQNGASLVTLSASAPGKSIGIRSMIGTEARWIMYLGDAAAESSTRTGSNFTLYSYDNSGANPLPALRIDRGLALATLYGDVAITGKLTVTGVTYGDVFENRSGTTLYLRAKAGAGNIVLRPDGDDTTVQALLSQVGTLSLCNGAAAATGGALLGMGMRGKVGTTGAYDTEWMNFSWTGSNLVAYANNSSLGNITITCDYRIKKAIRPLQGMWEKVKSLRPIAYSQREYEIWAEDSIERWGFLAHELQEKLLPSAATGVKDGPEVQSPNLLTVVAALTKALQEAMARIEALEVAA